MASAFDRRLKNILLKGRLLDEGSCAKAQETADQEGRSLAVVLVEGKAIQERELVGAVAAEMNLPPVDLERIQPSEEALEALSQEMSAYYGVVPLARTGRVLTLATANPFDILKLDDIALMTGCDIRPVVSSESAIREAIQRAYARDAQMMEEIMDEVEGDVDVAEVHKDIETADLAELAKNASGGHVVRFVNLMIYQAVRAGVSDIHIEPFEKNVAVRYRQDGALQEATSPPKKLQNAIVSRLKIMASLDIAEKRVPQDGKFQLKVEGRQVDFRVSVLPTIHGEKVVLRILDATNLALRLEDLGFEQQALDDFRKAIHNPYGMILVTGPTGSGKSTTLYSALREVMSVEDNIVTVEDPVEYQIPGVNQVQVNVKRGLTFAGALRSILRQDPDTILVGEIRDLETAEIAIKAALTGHMVLSTLHTNDAASSVTRLVDMGIDRFMVASSVLLVAAQRLARKLCDECKRPMTEMPPRKRLLELGYNEKELEGLTLYEPVGCQYCVHGFRGRFALMETLPCTQRIHRLIFEGASSMDIKAAAVEAGMQTLRRAGLLNAARGKTSVEEVLSVTRLDQ
ncbi:MAG: type IV-A pilus assembly ATPase PilB [Planctomycetota bacterium]